MPDYKNLSIGKLLTDGTHDIYTVDEGKSDTDLYLTFTNLGSQNVTVSIFKNEALDGTFLSQVGYGNDSTYTGLSGETLIEGDNISISYTGGIEMRYALVGVESDV